MALSGLASICHFDVMLFIVWVCRTCLLCDAHFNRIPSDAHRHLGNAWQMQAGLEVCFGIDNRQNKRESGQSVSWTTPE
jgi:hypothetical protein